MSSHDQIMKPGTVLQVEIVEKVGGFNLSSLLDDIGDDSSYVTVFKLKSNEQTFIGGLCSLTPQAVTQLKQKPFEVVCHPWPNEAWDRRYADRLVANSKPSMPDPYFVIPNPKEIQGTGVYWPNARWKYFKECHPVLFSPVKSFIKLFSSKLQP